MMPSLPRFACVYALPEEDLSLRLALKREARHTGVHALELRVSGLTGAGQAGRLRLHVECWRAAPGGEFVLVMDAYARLGEQAAACLAAGDWPVDAPLGLLGACYLEPPEAAEGRWMRVPGKFSLASAYLVRTDRLGELVAAGEAALAGGQGRRPEEILREVFADEVVGAWPPLAWLGPVRSGAGRREQFFDAHGVQLQVPHAVAHLPRVGGAAGAEGGLLTSPSTRQVEQAVPSRGVCTAWQGADDFPNVLNSARLLGTVVATGAGDGEFAQRALSLWRGKRWVAVDEWRVRPETEWLDLRNDQRPGVWKNHRAAIEELAAGEPRLKVLDASEDVAAGQFSDASVDAVWLDGDHSWCGMLASLERWWPKVREGGVLAGTGALNAFEGPNAGPFTWSLTEKALRHWAGQQGLQVLLARDTAQCWMVAKFTPPRPEEIMVITGATSNVDYLDVTSANHREYCARHGYGYRVFGDGDFARDRALCWSKIKFAREALRESRWVFWIDADAIFNRLDMKLEGFCWPQFLIICGLWDDAGFARPSFGTILLQQGPDTERMLAETWATPGKRYGDGHEEDGIKEVLAKWPELQSQVLCVHHRELNSCPPAKNWDADDFVLHFLQVRGTRRAVLADACAMARAGMWDGRPARNPGNGPPGAASEIGDRLGLGRRQADGQDAHATFRSGVAAVDAFLEHGYGQVRGMS